MKTKVLTIAAVVMLLTAVLAGCGTSGGTVDNTEAPAVDSSSAQPLKVVDFGYSLYFDGSAYLVDYAAIINNPNTGLTCRFPVITITAEDAQGNVMDTKERTLWDIIAGETTACSGTVFSLTEEPTNVKVEMTDENSGRIPGESVDYGLSMENIAIEKDFISSTVTGTLINSSKESYDYVSIEIVCRDDSGKLLGGYSTTQSDIAKKSETEIEFISGREVSGTASYEAFFSVTETE